jgi:hypothetical protein
MTCDHGSGVRGYLCPEVETLQKSGRVGLAVGRRRVCTLGLLWLDLLLLLAVQVAQTGVDLGSEMELHKQRSAELAVLAVRRHEGCRASRRCFQARRQA